VSGEEKVYGLLLCLAAGQRLAFPAAQIIAVEPWRAEDGFPHARAAYAVAPQGGRVLVADTGDAVAVDAVEVMQGAVPLMPAPALLSKALGGSLAGFAIAKDALWPVLHVAALSRFLSALQEAAA
jgi:hypothetical protein